MKPLSPRERQVLDYVVESGKISRKEIGAELGISPATVDNHVDKILAKMDVHSLYSAAIKWYKTTYLKPMLERAYQRGANDMREQLEAKWREPR